MCRYGQTNVDNCEGNQRFNDGRHADIGYGRRVSPREIRQVVMRACVLSFLLSASAANAAGMAVLDIENLAVAQQNARQTREILANDKELNAKTDQIAKALTGSRDGSLSLPPDGLGRGVAIAGAPSLGQFVQEDRMNLGRISPEARRAAAFMINGLMLAVTLQQQARSDGRTDAVNQVHRTRVRGSVLLAALGEQASRNAAVREQRISGAAIAVGRSEDIKGAVDENTRVGLETTRAVNELIAMQAVVLSTTSNELASEASRSTEVKKLLQYRDVNPFHAIGRGSSNGN
jgi:hypothetical protein